MRAYQGIFARFTLSSSASSASDFFFRPRPRNPILLLNLFYVFFGGWCSFFFWGEKFCLHFLPFSKQTKKQKKQHVEISMQKYVSFEERGTKNKKRKKRETRQDSLFYSLFLYLFSERKSTHTHNNTNTRALERLKERDDCKWFFFDVVVVFIITRSNFGTTARRRRFSSKEESTFTTTTTTTSSSSSATKENFCFE